MVQAPTSEGLRSIKECVHLQVCTPPRRRKSQSGCTYPRNKMMRTVPNESRAGTMPKAASCPRKRGNREMQTHQANAKNAEEPRSRKRETAGENGTYLGAVRGLRPSTTQWWLLPLHLLHTFAFFGKSHFIYTRIPGGERNRSGIRGGGRGPSCRHGTNTIR